MRVSEALRRHGGNCRPEREIVQFADIARTCRAARAIHREVAPHSVDSDVFTMAAPGRPR
ncbi:MAG: hypothetical protein ACTHOH_00285 [Lysobacteraceae bacterium]